MIVDRHANRIQIKDPHCKPKIPIELFFQSLVPRLVEKCQGNCGQKLLQSNEEDSLLIKPNGPITFLVNNEERTKVGPQYVHLNQKFLKEYLYRKHNVNRRISV